LRERQTGQLKAENLARNSPTMCPAQLSRKAYEEKQAKLGGFVAKQLQLGICGIDH